MADEDTKSAEVEELARLRAQVSALADANAMAAELMAELEEARAVEDALRRRGEELQLQHAIDEILGASRDEASLGLALLDTLTSAEGLELDSIGLVCVKDAGKLREIARLGDPASSFLEDAARARFGEIDPRPSMDAEGRVTVPIQSQERCFGCICLKTQVKSEWTDRWLGLLQIIGSRVGGALTRLTMARELEAARDEALEASVAKSRFLANMSHELRTPLNAIIGYSELLRDEAEDAGLDDFISDLDKVSSAGKHLLSLINDILDLSKIEAGKMDLHIESFEVKGLVRGVIDTIEPLARKNGNALEVLVDDAAGEMLSDEGKIRQNLFNLLSNACKFTSKGKVTLEARREDSEAGARVRFSVTDSGIGMTDEQLETVFEAFTQADSSTTRKFGGTGLGLAITQRFCQLMGGDIEVRSTVGEGTTFSFWLPARLRRADRQSSTAMRAVLNESSVVIAPPPGARRVLVVDDDPNARDMLGRVLETHGYAVEAVGSGEEALAAARIWKPDAITLDVMMPGRDGWSVLGALKDDPATAHIPVVMVTIVPEQEMGMALGAADYLIKPVERKTLLRSIRQQLDDPKPGYALVVDDDKSAREVVVRTLAREGWETCEAENGAIALEKVDARAPTLILLDLMMPVMDGFDFLRTLRSRKDGVSIPVVVMTARKLDSDERAQLKSTVHEIVEKRRDGLDELTHIVDLVASSLPTSP